jgi:hypothetical protein
MHVRSSARCSTAARIFCRISAVEITSWPSKCPQRLGATWSSSWMPAAPAFSSTWTVRATETALPNPVSASAITGIPTASVMARTWAAISESESRPRSGSPRKVLVTPAPVT